MLAKVASKLSGHGARMGLFLILAVGVFSVFHQRAPAADRPGPLQEYLLPVFGHGGLPPGIQFQSVIVLLNLSSTTSAAAVLTQDANGEPIDLLQGPGDMAVSSTSRTIPAGGTAEIRSKNNNPSQVQSGAARIIAFNNQVAAQVEFSIFNGNRLAARAQVPGRPLSQAGSFPIGSSGRTGFAVLNPQFVGGATEVRVGSVNPQGRVIDFEIFDLMPGQQRSLFLDQLINVQGATSAEFRADQPVAILPLQQDGLVLTTQDIFPPRSVQTLFPSSN